MNAGVGAALHRPGFGRLMLALAVSGLGDWLYNVALLALVWDRTHSPLWLTLTTTVRLAPIVVLGPLGGLMAQRVNRRVVMVVSDLLRVGLMVALAVVAAAGLPIWLAPALAGLATVAAAPYPPCVAASTPRLVGDEHLAGANAARAAIGPASIVLGPVIGAALLAVTTPATVILLNALTFALSALAVLSIRVPAAFRAAGTAEPLGLLQELAGGARALFGHRLAVRMVGADTASSAVYGAQTVLLLPVSMRLGLGDSGLGLMLGALGAGGVLGTVFAGRLASRRDSLSLVRTALVVAALTLPLLGVGRLAATAVLLAAISGLGSMVVEVCVETTLQRSLPEDVFAAAYGFAFPVAIAGIVAGAGVASLLYSVAGLQTALVVLGLALASCGMAVAAGARDPLRDRVALAA